MKFVTLDRTTSAWFRDVVQTEGVIIQYCFVLSGISVTAEWQWHVSELLSLPMLPQVFPCMIPLTAETDFIISWESTGNFLLEWWNMSCKPVCLLWELKNLLHQKASCYKNLFYNMFSWSSVLLVLKAMLYDSCVVTFSSWNIVMYSKKPGCAGPKICPCLFK